MLEQKNPRWNQYGIPLIPQLFNTCGLSTVLMLTAKASHLQQNNRVFLSRVLQHIQPILVDKVENMDREISLQYVLQYLLLKIENPSTANYQLVNKYLYDKFGHVFRDQITIHSHLMTEKMNFLNKMHDYSTYDSYRLYKEKSGLITPNLLRNEMFTMKSDLELKFLMEIFGFQFIPNQFNPNDSGDGTGALYMASKKRKKDYEKIQILLTKITSNPTYRVLYGVHSHWVALTGMSEDEDGGNVLIHYNDPMIPEAKTISLNEIDESHRFYVFKDSEAKVSELWGQIEQVITQEIQVEKNLQETAAVEKVLASREEVNIDLVKKLNLIRKISVLSDGRGSKSKAKFMGKSKAKSKSILETKSKSNVKSKTSTKLDSDSSTQLPKKGNLSKKGKEWDTDIDFDFEDHN
ncbi:MAG: hypothetical protein ACTSYI_09825 [Promethearchaeota archaeon]